MKDMVISREERASRDSCSRDIKIQMAREQWLQRERGARLLSRSRIHVQRVKRTIDYTRELKLCYMKDLGEAFVCAYRWAEAKG